MMMNEKEKQQQHKLLIEIHFYDETFVSGSILNVSIAQNQNLFSYTTNI